VTEKSVATGAVANTWTEQTVDDTWGPGTSHTGTR